jgi:hypothetical protein
VTQDPGQPTGARSPSPAAPSPPPAFGSGRPTGGSSRAPDPDRDPGVPEAEVRALRELLTRVPPERLHGLWRFPPLRRGRRESGLMAAGVYPSEEGEPPGGGEPGTDGRQEPDRLVLVTLAWRAEETGKGVVFEPRFAEEGEAPPDRLPRVMAGVVRRMDEATGEPRYLSVGGDAATLRTLMEEMDT